jgi:hypothetical protein
MKYLFTFLFILGCFWSISQVGIGTNTPDQSAILDLTSTNKGVLITRIALTSNLDVTTIPSPATGLLIYNTATAGSSSSQITPGYYTFNGANWDRLLVNKEETIVNFNTTNPNSGSPLFTPNSPSNSAFIYVSSNNGSKWIWNGSIYIEYKENNSSPFYLLGTTNDAGSNKLGSVYRLGNVGVGTSNPSAKFHVSGTTKLDLGSDASGDLLYRSSTGNLATLAIGLTNKYLKSNGTSPIWADGFSFYLGNGTNSVTSATRDLNDWVVTKGVSIVSTDNLANPTNKPNGLGAWYGTGIQSVGAGYYSQIYLTDQNAFFRGGSVSTINANDWRTILNFNSFNKFEAQVASNTADGDLTLMKTGNFSLLFGTNNAVRMKISNTGSVGIGTTSPTNNLNVIGGFDLRSAAGAAGTGYGIEFNTNSSSPRIDWVHNGAYTGAFASDADFYFRLQNSKAGAGGFRFLTNPSSGGVERFTILNNGNIGVNNTTPTSRFEVNGAITNKTAFNAAAATTIDFSNSNLAYTTASPGAFTLNNIKDGGCYTLAVRGTTAGTSSFVSTGFTFKSVSNGITDSGFETLYKFTVIGSVIYVEMIKGL